MHPIPEELVSLAAQRRLIPFVGAGFSASLGLPSWETMLRDVCEGSERALPFDELLAATNSDLLQVAEYLYLKHDRQIGPIRHQIEKSFATSPVEPLLSGPHVELANLGAGQIYTTNYDDIIEQTYRSLGLPFAPVILPKDVALADTDRTQIVKYHGDLSHERTLVLTESAYYQRLDFESPMDLKFRSDLLGKSVLFMGYSFRDINIRIIWFKLMQMMKDIPESDRRPSYIVRIESNPALEELYAAVGLRSIVLSPTEPVTSDAERTALLGRFLLDLSSRASTRARRRGASRMHAVYVSQAGLDYARERVSSFESIYGASGRAGFRFGGVVSLEDPAIQRLFDGVVPAPLKPAWDECVTKILPFVGADSRAVSALTSLAASDSLTRYVVELLASNGSEQSRKTKRQIVQMEDLWPKVWRHDIEPLQAQEILATFSSEIAYQAQQGADEDIAYLADLARRIEQGLLVAKDHPPGLRERATDLLIAASQIYPSIGDLSPEKQAAPELSAVLSEVEARASAFQPIEVDLRTLRRLKDPREPGRKEPPSARGRARADASDS